MTEPILTVARAPEAPAQPRQLARELAARIQIPTALPPRYDGQPLAHLSHSSYSLLLLCPEQWRRRYLKGEHQPTTGAMFLGSAVDHALTTYYQHLLDHENCLSTEQLADAFRDHWHQALAETDVRWENENPRHTFATGIAALHVTLTELVPRLGQPVAVQRRLEFALAPVKWTVLCYPDLEALSLGSDDAPTASIVDFKVKRTAVTQMRADHDTQPSLYLAGRWLTGEPAQRFTYAQVVKPSARHPQPRASLVHTTRTTAQLRGILARIAQAARLISAFHERLGPDEPWTFADPSSWKCQPRFCDAWPGCPGGAGLP